MRQSELRIVVATMLIIVSSVFEGSWVSAGNNPSGCARRAQCACPREPVTEMPEAGNRQHHTALAFRLASEPETVAPEHGGACLPQLPVRIMLTD